MLEQPRTTPGARNQPDHLKKKHETYLPQRPKTKRKMDPALAGQPSVHVNTFEQWLANMAPQLQAVCDAAKVHAQRSRGSATAETAKSKPKESELPVVAPELTSELLHCLSTLPDPWPLAKITINMDSASQWVSRMCRLFFAHEYARHTVGTPTASQVPDMESAFQAVQNALPKLENRIIDFFPLVWPMSHCGSVLT